MLHITFYDNSYVKIIIVSPFILTKKYFCHIEAIHTISKISFYPNTYIFNIKLIKHFGQYCLGQYLSVDHDVEDSEEKERNHSVHQAVQDDQVHLVHL